MGRNILMSERPPEHPLRGRKQTPEHIAARSRALKGRRPPVFTPEQREKYRQAMTGNQWAKGRKVGDEEKERSRRNSIGNQWAKGYKFTPEQRQRKSEAAKKAWAEGKWNKRRVHDGERRTAFSGHGHHNGVYMRCINSEGVFARDLDDAGIKWVYEPRRFRLSCCTYLPDFYLSEFDIWVEIKGWPEQPGSWPQKVNLFREETGKTLVVVFHRELSSLTYGGECDDPKS